MLAPVRGHRERGTAVGGVRVVIGGNVFDCEHAITVENESLFDIRWSDGKTTVDVTVKSPPAKRPLRVRANRVEEGDAKIEAGATSVTIRVGGAPVMSVNSRADEASVDLDLRPLGLTIFTDAQGLHLGTNLISRCSAIGTKVGLAIG